MDIGILGTGRMGLGLGRVWAAAGHAVVLGGRDPHALRGRLGGEPAGLVAGDHAAAAARPVVVLATPYRATADLVRSHAAALAGKVVIDLTNPFGAAPPGASGLDVHREALGGIAHWAVAFKTNFAATIGAPDGVVRQCLIAADVAPAREAATELARAAGFEVVDCGGLACAAVLDGMVPLMIDLDRRLGGGGGRSHWRFAAGV